MSASSAILAAGTGGRKPAPARARATWRDATGRARQYRPRVVERIAEIPTRFWLASECDRQLLTVSASKVVAQNRNAITDFPAASSR